MHRSVFPAYSLDTFPVTLDEYLESADSVEAETEDSETPRKRRKVVGREDVLRDTEPSHWQDYLLLAIVGLQIKFPCLPSTYSALPPSAGQGRPIRIARFDQVDDDEFSCDLETIDNEQLARVRLRSEISPKALKIIRSATNVPKNDSYVKFNCSIKKLSHCGSDVTYSLGLKIRWKISHTLKDARPNDPQNKLLAMLGSGETSHTMNASSPHDFYDSVHVPDKDCQAADDIYIPKLGSQLYPFQKRALQWLLHREGVDLQGKELKVGVLDHTGSELPLGFSRTTDANGRPCYLSPWLGIAITDQRLLQQTEQYLHGGILAEEMGLGKTIEVIALICRHTRSKPTEPQPNTTLLQSSATLIITPPSILQQWKSELQAHAPSLKVMIYEGIKSVSNKCSNEQTLKQLLLFDVVLMTYRTLGSEIHYSGPTVTRNLRFERKYARSQSPLVQIDWWRVVLDECQMVESGVSNAAKVAQLISRRNAWAVSGTPLKKDMKDLLGLFIFLRLEPYCNSSHMWNALITSHKGIFKQLIKAITLRHTKDYVKEDIQLPIQKRLVITIPFTPIEEQHYSDMFHQMCKECGLNTNGEPLDDAWDPNSPFTIEKMRNWLTRLRQTCLHPEVGDRNRRALGHREGPLRTVDEVLLVMIEQNEIANRLEERSYVLSKLKRGQYLECKGHSQDALSIWLEVLQQSKASVEDCRRETFFTQSFSVNPLSVLVQDAESSTGSRSYSRLRLRSALEIEHMSTFFVANAYYQIKSDSKITPPTSLCYAELGTAEVEMYERAKVLRKEILKESNMRVDQLMITVKSKVDDRNFVKIPNFTPFAHLQGNESRNVLARCERLCQSLNIQAEILNQWRERMTKLLLLPLIDQEEDPELEGDEYELSLKQQDEVYVYMEGLRALVADRHDALTGQDNILIRGEMGNALQQAVNGRGHAPDLMRELLATRMEVKPKAELGSIRGITMELRGLKTALRGPEEKASRANTEMNIVNSALQDLQLHSTRQSKAVTGLEQELEIFRDTMNARLEYYRQLQTISDAVAPVQEIFDDDASLQAELKSMESSERRMLARINTLKSQGRYLLHLRDSTKTDNAERMCIICQQPFEVGVLTSCGHSYCKECLRLWWNSHRNCPACKKKLPKEDLHQITYKPQEMTVQEEFQSKSADSSHENESTSSIYSDVSTATLNQIKNIDVEGSFGTKIDTLARHILWIRENDAGAKSIVFSQFRDFLDILARAFSKFKIGFTSIDKKNGVEKFKNEPSIECFFLHAKAHSSGLNLVNATHVFLCEPLINTALELQAIARVHRIGQHHSTTVWMYLVENSVEKAIYDISVTRRMAHVSRNGSKAAVEGVAAGGIDDEIENANSLELREASIAQLLAKGAKGGELVQKEDLWNCLFQQRPADGAQHGFVDDEAEAVTAQFLGGQAAQGRALHNRTGSTGGLRLTGQSGGTDAE